MQILFCRHKRNVRPAGYRPSKREYALHAQISVWHFQGSRISPDRNYRENYDMFACSGILYNNESPQRGFEFVTRKITSHVAKIKAGIADRLKLGNLDAKRDWGHAREYMKAVWRMLQQDKPDDYIICTRKLHSVRDFCQEAFSYAGLDYQDYVVFSPKFYREDNALLTGDTTLARTKFGWKPHIAFRELVQEMVDSDMNLLKNKIKDT